MNFDFGRRWEVWLAVAITAGLLLFGDVLDAATSAQSSVTVASPSIFRVGEKLSYTISYGKISNAGLADTYVISRGKIAGKDAVEVRGKVKTTDLVAAAFFMLDESRTAFAAPETGLPHYITTRSLDSVSPKQTIRNYIAQPTSSFDLLTLMFKARESGGIGSFPLVEGDQLHTVTFQGSVAEKVRTEAGDFDTLLSTVQSDFLSAHGVKELKINFATDEFHVPVLVRMKTARGEFRASLTAISLPEPEASPTPMPAVPTSKPIAAPKQTPTPPQYVDDLPLMPELGFQLGEVLDYGVTYDRKSVGRITLNARTRTLFEKNDTLLLVAAVTAVESGTDVLRLGDTARAYVDPDTLTPYRAESKFASKSVGASQTVVFDRKSGNINFGGKQGIDGPIGTHSLLSLAYAMRSFNLKPSSDRTAPVNDTRVAVFWETKPYIFILRPGKSEEITLNGEKTAAQMISISTGNKELDAYNIKVWLRTNDRVPVRFSFGAFQADLISISANLLQ